MKLNLSCVNWQQTRLRKKSEEAEILITQLVLVTRSNYWNQECLQNWCSNANQRFPASQSSISGAIVIHCWFLHLNQRSASPPQDRTTRGVTAPNTM